MRVLVCIVAAQLWTLQVAAQAPVQTVAYPAQSSANADIVQTRGIASPLQRANIGKIAFTDREIPLLRLKAKDFLRRYTLTSNSDLFITVFMDNSLTNSLHRLVPGLPGDSLTKLGGYQFALFVDGRLVYRSNILGAPYPKIKDTETTVSKPLIDNKREGVWWSQFFWGRFMAHGGDSALTEGNHLLRLEIRPYASLASGVKEGEIIAAGDLTMRVRRKPAIDVSKIRLNPILPYEGLGISTDKFDSDRIKELKGNIEAGVFKQISSVVVIKNGNILVEEYFNGETRDTQHDPRSVGKSFASTMTGIAIGEGYLKSEAQTLKEFYNLRSYAHYSPEKEDVSLKDLLTMCSAFDGDDADGNSPGNEENMYPTGNWVKFALDLPVSATRPRDQWHYFTAGAMLMGDILNSRVPGGSTPMPMQSCSVRWAFGIISGSIRRSMSPIRPAASGLRRWTLPNTGSCIRMAAYGRADRSCRRNGSARRLRNTNRYRAGRRTFTAIFSGTRRIT